jgi:hypothetical protein
VTISSSTRKAGPFTGNNTTATYPFAFKIFQASDLLVVRTSLTGVETTLALTTDYTVSLNADQNSSPGGSVTLVAGNLATGLLLTMTSQVPYTQTTDLTNQGGFYPQVITNALDKVTIAIQQLALDASRSVKVDLSSSETGDELKDRIFDAADDASADAAAAAASASAAASSQASASSSASTATTQAGIATTQASNASSSASAASGSASSASSSASAASASASTATTQASNASTSASTATTQAGIATTQAGIATTQAGNAASSASAAAASESAAAASAAAAATALDNFDDRYLGSKTSDPTVDNDGNPLVVGALYYRSTAPIGMKVYDGAQWLEASAAQQAALVAYEYVATAGQTTFSGADANGLTLSYIAGGLIVALNGVVLRPGDDYTATNGTSVVLAAAAALHDELVMYAFASFNVANTYTQAQVDAALALKANANATVNLTGAQSIAGAKRGSITALTDGATITPDFSLNNHYEVTLGGNRTLANPTNVVAGQSGVIRVVQDGSGSRTLAYGSNWKFSNGAAPVLTTTINAVDLLVYFCESSTRIAARLVSDVK